METSDKYIDHENSVEYFEERLLYCWGFGKYGQIGIQLINTSTVPIKQIIDEKEDDDEIFSISGGECHSVILTLNSNLFVYGKNYFGQLGLGNNLYVYKPTLLTFFQKIKIQKVSCGGDHTLALDENSNLYAWGLNAFGQLGLGDYLARNEPVLVDIHKENYKETFDNNEIIENISLGAQHSMILTNKNKLYTCGYSKYFSLGYASEEDVNIFTMVNLGTEISKINKITCSVYHSGCIIGSDIFCIWGKGEVLNFLEPTFFSPKNIDSSHIRELKFGEDTAFILTKNDEILAMGDNKYGQLGNNSTISRKNLEKVQIPHKIKQIEVGYNFLIALSYHNTIYGWGNNEYGQLASASNSIILTPTELNELSKMEVVKLACGGYHCLGLFKKNLNDNVDDVNNLDNISNVKFPNSHNPKIIEQSIIDEKMKLIETMEQKVNDLEYNIMEKSKVIKELVEKEEEILKRYENISSYRELYLNEKGFDRGLEISLNEIEFLDDEKQAISGTFGEVRKGIWRKETVAVKFLKPNLAETKKVVLSFIEECRILKNLRHRNILLFMGASTIPPKYFIVTEFCENGNLFELLHQKKNIILDWDNKRNIALQIALGMNYLHSFKPPIIHRDLKSLNILLDANYQVKIADFGNTKFLEDQNTVKTGTFQWMAPEVYNSNSYTEKADVFSFGIIMHEIASRTPPFLGKTAREIGRRVSMDPKFRPVISKQFPKEWCDLMVKCWDHNYNIRPSFNEIVDILTTMK